jgi:SAM-dependent methyltransferase
VLRTHEEVSASVDQVRRLGLPESRLPGKNWDSLAALDVVLRMTGRDARIFDAGGETYSVILPWLSRYGYRNLVCGNISFASTFQRGPIRFELADITGTTYPDGHFDAITCLSVIEHGVDVGLYVREMSRILKPGGALVTSTDYYETPIDTRGYTAYGAPVRVFTKPEIVRMLEQAEDVGLTPLGPLDLTAGEKVVHWRRFDLRYTFLVCSLRKLR